MQPSLGAPGLECSVVMGTGCYCYGNYRTKNMLAMEGHEEEMFQKTKAEWLGHRENEQHFESFFLCNLKCCAYC